VLGLRRLFAETSRPILGPPEVRRLKSAFVRTTDGSSSTMGSRWRNGHWPPPTSSESSSSHFPSPQRDASTPPPCRCHLFFLPLTGDARAIRRSLYACIGQREEENDGDAHAGVRACGVPTVATHMNARALACDEYNAHDTSRGLRRRFTLRRITKFWVLWLYVSLAPARTNKTNALASTWHFISIRDWRSASMTCARAMFHRIYSAKDFWDYRKHSDAFDSL